MMIYILPAGKTPSLSGLPAQNQKKIKKTEISSMGSSIRIADIMSVLQSYDERLWPFDRIWNKNF